MRRFNLEVVLVALIGLALLIKWLFSTWEAFQKSVPLSRPRLSTAIEKRCLPGRPRSFGFLSVTNVDAIETYIRFTESDLLAMGAFLDERARLLESGQPVQAPRDPAS